MNDDYIRGLIQHLEELGASPDVIEEVAAALPKNTSQEVTKPPENDAVLLAKQEMDSEPDWRKRASTAAGIISKNLDNGY